MIRLVMVAEIADARTIAEAQAYIDEFREATLPSLLGICLYRATRDDVERAKWAGDSDPDHVDAMEEHGRLEGRPMDRERFCSD